MSALFIKGINIPFLYFYGEKMSEAKGFPKECYVTGGISWLYNSLLDFAEERDSEQDKDRE